MLHRIQFGLTDGVRAVFGGRSSFPVPKFGTSCVCCNGDAGGKVQDYDPSTDRVQADPIAVPVCEQCLEHAFTTQNSIIFSVSGVLVGIALTILAIIYLKERPEDTFLWGMLVVGVAVFAAGVGWIVVDNRKKKTLHANGHHAGFIFSVDGGRILIDTTNPSLADELVSLNPNARRL